MDLVRAQLDAIAARLAVHGSVAPGAEFAELAPEVPPALVAAVDGSSRMLLDGGAFAVVALRAGRVVVRDAEEVLEREAPLEVRLLEADTFADKWSECYREATGRLPSEQPPDLQAALEWLRELAETEAALAALEALAIAGAPGSLLLLDGALTSPHAPARDALRLVLDRADAAGVTVAAVAKRSSLARDGAPVLPALMRDSPDGCWRTALDCDSLGKSGAVRLNPASEWAFRLDVAGGDYGTVAASLVALARDAVYPGYPWPLAQAHNLVLIDGDLTDALRQALQGAALEQGLAPGAWDVLFSDYHEVLDRSV
ncbi:MAG TPA: hypothetical protein EYG25_00095 [Candidatus Poseidoniales archaeon]|uniref:NurA domain-containing protein n=1 Tax=Marine Group III euryarchaeote TaxID=2173149 RepID=A0A7C8DMK3_9ARCH|nr:hypothetical protein [Marine Group III euryarchaeote]HIL32685.1 hypothetical protein [Candidatus Poseidoniales archaeon]